MSDLTREQLARWRAEFSGRTPRPEEWPDAGEIRALVDAADERDRLRAENERLRRGLESEIERLDVRPGTPPGSRDYPPDASLRMKIRNRLQALLNDGGDHG